MRRTSLIVGVLAALAVCGCAAAQVLPAPADLSPPPAPLFPPDDPAATTLDRPADLTAADASDEAAATIPGGDGPVIDARFRFLPPADLVRRADDAWRSGDLLRAATLYGLARDRGAYTPHVFTRLGDFARLTGDAAAARARYLDALQLDMHWWPAWDAFALVLMSEGRLRDVLKPVSGPDGDRFIDRTPGAISVLQELIDRRRSVGLPIAARTWFNLAVCYDRLQQFSEARSAYAACIAAGLTVDAASVGPARARASELAPLE
jgi:tetratricopeptide (TPR) repeat protein